MSAGTNVR